MLRVSQTFFKSVILFFLHNIFVCFRYIGKNRYIAFLLFDTHEAKRITARKIYLATF